MTPALEPSTESVTAPEAIVAPAASETVKKRRGARACLECRSLKVACVPATQGAEACTRCSRFGFDCIYTTHARGRKPKRQLPPRSAVHHAPSSTATLETNMNSHHQSVSDSILPVADDSLDLPEPSEILGVEVESDESSDADGEESSHEDDEPRTFDSARRRGPTFTFLNQSNDNSSRPRTPIENLSPPAEPCRADGARARKSVQGTFSMRDMLRPVGPIAADYLPEPEQSHKKKDGGGVNNDDPVSLGYVSLAIATHLFDYFYRQLNSWSGVLDPRYDTHDAIRQRSPFLYTAILCVSSLHNQDHVTVTSPLSDAASGIVTTDRIFLRPMAYQQISVLAVNHATSAFIDGYSTLGVVQAFYLLSTWKGPDDSVSYLRTGYAAKLAMDLDLSCRYRSRKLLIDANPQAVHEDRVQGFQFFNAYMMPLHDPLIADCTSWHRHTHAMLSDVMLVASVECRRLQSNFRDQISLVVAADERDHAAGSNGSGNRMRTSMLEMLLPSIQSALSDWYIHWSKEVKDHVRSRAGTILESTFRPDEYVHNALRVMRIWQHSIQLHLCSFALSDAMSAHARSGSGPSGSIALWPVVSAAQGILKEFAALPAERLRAAPDTMSLLPDLAAVCLWRLSRMDEHLATTPNFGETNIALMSDVVRNFRSAVVYRTDVGLLHARFLLSVVTRMKEGRKREAANSAKAQEMPIQPMAAPTFEDFSGMFSTAQVPMLMQPPTTNESPTLSLPTVPDPAFAEFDMTLFGNNGNGNDLSNLLMPPSDAAGVWSDNPLAFFPFDMDAMMNVFPNDNGSGGAMLNLFG